MTWSIAFAEILRIRHLERNGDRIVEKPVRCSNPQINTAKVKQESIPCVLTSRIQADAEPRASDILRRCTLLYLAFVSPHGQNNEGKAHLVPADRSTSQYPGKSYVIAVDQKLA